MKRLLFAAASAASLCIAAPVLAQDYPPTPTPPPTAAMPGHDIRGQLDSLRQRVQSGFQQGQLSREETDRLYNEIDRIRAVADSDRDASGQLTEHARSDLQGRIDGLSRSIHWQRAEGGAALTPPGYMGAAHTTTARPSSYAAAAPTSGWSLDQREQWLQDRIARGIDNGGLSGQEAARGQQELGAIRSEQAQLSDRDGGALSPEDRSYLVHRIDELNQTLRWSGRNPPPPWMGM
jgi:hypothetical protein